MHRTVSVAVSSQRVDPQTTGAPQATDMLTDSEIHPLVHAQASPVSTVGRTAALCCD